MRCLLIRRLFVAGVALLLAAAFAPASFGAESAQKGQLRILRGGKVIGQENYEIITTPTEVQARGTLEIQVDDQTVRQTSQVLLGADFTPRSYELTMESPEKTWRRVEFAGGKGTFRYPLAEGKNDEQIFEFGTSRVAVLGLYHHFLLLARLYDFAQGGSQTLQIFIPWAGQPGEAKVELAGVETKEVAGQSQAVRELLITTEDNQVRFWVTAAGEFVRLQSALETIEVVPETPAP